MNTSAVSKPAKKPTQWWVPVVMAFVGLYIFGTLSTLSTLPAEQNDDVGKLIVLGDSVKKLGATSYAIGGHTFDIHIPSMALYEAQGVADAMCSYGTKWTFRYKWDVRVYLLVNSTQPAATCTLG
jgi:hypothetical protein